MAADKPDITTVIFGSYERVSADLADRSGAAVCKTRELTCRLCRIKTWYSSPYPIEEELRNEALAAEREAHQARMQQLDVRPSKRSRPNTSVDAARRLWRGQEELTCCSILLVSSLAQPGKPLHSIAKQPRLAKPVMSLMR